MSLKTRGTRSFYEKGGMDHIFDMLSSIIDIPFDVQIICKTLSSNNNNKTA